jgi:periplasmic protein CpxP/Spy
MSVCYLFNKAGDILMKKPNMIFKSIMLSSLLTFATAGPVYAYGGQGKNYDRHHVGGPGKMGYIMSQLELSDKQRAAMSKIRDEQRQKMRAKRDEMTELQKKMSEQMRSEKYDADKVRELADAQAKIMSDMMVLRAEGMNRMHEQLTADQEARIKQMKEQMEARRAERGYPEQRPR